MARRKKTGNEDSPMNEAATARASLRIEGELTIYTAADTKTRLVEALAAADRGLDIDLAEVSEIDSAGLQLLLLAKREAAARGGEVALVNHSAAVLECFDLCNMTATFGDQVVIAAAAQE